MQGAIFWSLCYLLWLCSPFVLQLILKMVFPLCKGHVLTELTKRLSALLLRVQNKCTVTVFFHLSYNCGCCLFKNSSGQCDLVYIDLVPLVLTLVLIFY